MHGIPHLTDREVYEETSINLDWNVLWEGRGGGGGGGSTTTTYMEQFTLTKLTASLHLINRACIMAQRSHHLSWLIKSRDSRPQW